MVGHGEDTKFYNIFYPLTKNTFIEISVQFEEEVIPYFELAPRECSSPQNHDDVSDESTSDFYEIYDNEMDEDDFSVP